MAQVLNSCWFLAASELNLTYRSAPPMEVDIPCLVADLFGDNEESDAADDAQMPPQDIVNDGEREFEDSAGKTLDPGAL